MKTFTVHVGELALNDSGAFKIGPFGSSLKKTELVESGIPVAGIENVLPNNFVKGFRRFITARKFEELSDYEILPDDVLVTTMGTIGRAAAAPRDLGRVIFDSHLFRMRVDTSRVFPPYLCYALNSDLVASQLARMARGAIMEGLNTTILRECSVPLPEMSEQQRIAGRLEQADRLRRTRRYALELTDTFLPAAFLELFGDLDREPSRWDCIEFDRMCKISEDTVDPKNPAYADLAQISSEDIKCVSGELGPLRTARQKGVISVNFLIQPHELLFSKIRPKLRKVAHPGFKALCSADIYPIRIVNPNCHLSYLLFYLRSDHFSSIVARLAEARSNIPKVNRDELSEQTIPLPPLALQQKFAALVERAERLRAVQREALRQAEHLFASLLHRAFSGEL